MKPALVLSLVTVFGIGGPYLASELFTPTPVVIQQTEKISPLESARRATFLISLKDYRVSGSAVLVGRKNLGNGMYRYRALTAHHVIKPMADKLLKQIENTSRKLTLMLQPQFHGPPLRLQLDIDDIEWAAPTEDWAAITFDSAHKLTCVEVASKAEFQAIKSFEKIYAVGCGGGFGQACRQGVIGATHNEHLDVMSQKMLGKWPWHKLPRKFFRPFINAWYGDSGGGVFSKEGKLIGLINAAGMMSRGWDQTPVPHSTVAVKTHIIKDLVSISKDFFLIEE